MPSVCEPCPFWLQPAVPVSSHHLRSWKLRGTTQFFEVLFISFVPGPLFLVSPVCKEYLSSSVHLLTC